MEVEANVAISHNDEIGAGKEGFGGVGILNGEGIPNRSIR